MKSGIGYDHSLSNSLDETCALLKDTFTLQAHKVLFIGKQSAKLQKSLLPFVNESERENLVTVYDVAEAVKKISGLSAKPGELRGVVCDASFADADIKTITNKLEVSLCISSFILYADQFSKEHKTKAVSLEGVDDFLYAQMGWNNIFDRIAFLANFKLKASTYQVADKGLEEYVLFKKSFAKSLLDVSLAFVLLLLLSPIFLLVILLIKIESPGSAFFISKRVGTNYNIFDFYKFRTMKVGANSMRDILIHLNTYNPKEGTEKDENSPFFFKIKDDPRVTRVGKFLRKTSLDELPQLINVLKGDMSLVGNRPLPLDEAATLTKDEWAARFLAPSGMTGLWQVSEKKDEVTVPERIALDLAYAKDISLGHDLKILWKTVPAMFQK